MAIYHCTGCDHSTNTTFVDMIADRGANLTVIRCGGRYVRGGAVNEVERGCGYDTLAADIREHVDRAIRNSRARLAKASIKCVACPATFATLAECEAHDCPGDLNRDRRKHWDKTASDAKAAVPAASGAPVQSTSAAAFAADFIAKHPNEWAEAQHRMQARHHGA
jgi:hypothetical protein